MILFLLIGLGSFPASAQFLNNFSKVEAKVYKAKGLDLLQIAPDKLPTNGIHVFSHGRPGALLIDGQWMGPASLVAWLSNQPGFAAEKAVYLYGCSFAKGLEGQAAIAYLENQLHKTIYASNNISGLGGDWILETGGIDLSQAIVDAPIALQCANFGTNPSQDFDCDGVINSLDQDDDNDGITDVVECNIPCPDLFLNGSFESPVFANNTVNYVPQTTPNFYWQTTATDGIIEIWRQPFNGVPAAQGSQFAELNANQVSTLYQTFCLNGSSGTVTWSVKHRGRSGVDVAAVKFGATIAAAQAAAPAATMSDGNTAWGTYSGSYTIPAGQTTLVIAFQSISSVGGATLGNFIDDVQITITQGCPDSDLDGALNSMDLDSDNDGCSDANEYYNNNNADGGDGGRYGVGTPAVNASGLVTAATYTGSLTNVVAASSASTITGQPSDQVSVIGGSASFSVTATGGSGVRQFQWQVSTNNGTTWSNISNGGVYSGVTTATLSLSSIPVGYDGYDYRVLVYQSDRICEVVSSSANLCLQSPPTIGTITNPLCISGTGSVQLTGLPSSGSWTIQQAGTATATYTGSGTTYTVNNLAIGSYTFRVRNSTGCTSFSSATVNIVNTAVSPSASNAGPDQTICSSPGTVTMAGNNPAAGTGTWTKISGPASGTITDANLYNTTITGLSAGTYVYRWSISNGCVANTDDISIVVQPIPTAANAGGDQTVCAVPGVVTLAANAPAVGTGNWSKISGPVSGTITAPSANNSTVTGLSVGTYVFRWTTSNGVCASSTDDVSITVQSTPTTAFAGADQTICEAPGTVTMAANNPTIGIGSWAKISGPASGSITNPVSNTTTVTSLSAGTYVFRWTVVNGTCAASTDDVSIVVQSVPTPAAAGVDKTICISTATVAMTGNTPVVGTGAWTQVSGPSSATIGTSSSPTTSIGGLNTAGTYVFRWTITNGTCAASTDDVNVIVQALPSTANAGVDKAICINTPTSTMTGNVPVTGTGTWTQVSGPTTATITTPGSATTTITGLNAAGTFVFRWTISNGTCTSTNDDVSVVVFALPTAANAGPDQTICGGSTTLAGNNPLNGTGQWSYISGPAGSTITNPALRNTTLTGLIAGTYVFRWTITNGSCAVRTDDVSIVVLAGSEIANAGPDQTICVSSGSITMAATVPGSGSTGNWTQVSGPNTATITSSSLANSTITGIVPGTYVFRWSVTTTPCTPTTDEVTIIVQPSPTTADAGPDQTVCVSVGTALMAANNPSVGSGLWTKVSGPVGATISNNTSNSTNINFTAAGIYNYRWTISNGTCTPSTDNIVITVLALPTTANAGADKEICVTTGAVAMTGNTATIGTGLWTQVSGPSSATITAPTNAASNITGLTSPGIYVFRWSITNGVCTPSMDEVTVTVSGLPSAANAGPDQTICAANANMAALVPTTGNGMWSFVAGNPGSTIGNPSSASSSITGLTPGTYTFRWTVTSGSCGATNDETNVVVSSLSSTSNAGTDQNICATTSSVSLTANAPSSGSGMWSQTSGPNTATIAQANNASTMVSGLIAGTYVFRWTITNPPCAPSFDEVTILVDPIPSAANAGSDQTVCVTGGSTTLAANAALIGTGTWTKISGPSGGAITSPNDPASTITGLNVGTYVYQWTVSNGTCSSTSDQVSIVVQAAASTSLAGTDKTICVSSASVNMTGNTPASGTGTWTQVSGPSSTSINAPNTPTTTITGLNTVGTYVFRWTISNGVCAVNSDEVNVVVDPLPTVADAGTDQNSCITTSTVTLAANSPVTGTGSWSKVSGPTGGNIANPTNPNTNISSLSVGTYVYQWTISNGTCASSSDQVNIVIQPVPTVSNAGPDQTICVSTASVNMSGNNPVTGTGNWSQVSGPGVGTIASPSSPTTTISNLTSAGVYQFRWTITNGVCAGSADEVSIQVDALPTIANAGADQLICSSNTLMEANAPVTGTGQWSLVSGASGYTLGNPSHPNSGITGLNAGNYQFRWTVVNGTCAPSTDDVSVQVQPLTSTANAGSDQTICVSVGTVTMAANNPTAGTGVWSQISGPNTASIAAVNNSNTTITNIQPGVYVFRWTINNLPCAPSFDEVSITVDAIPTTADAGVDQIVCIASGPITLSGNTPGIGTGLWTKVSGPVGASLSAPTAPVTQLNVSASGNYTYRWTISNGTCTASRDEVSIQVQALPTVANAGADQNICVSSATTVLAGNTPVTGTGTWIQVSGPVTATINNPTTPGTSLSGLNTIGTYTFRWTISNGVCSSSTDDVTITVDAQPTLANAGADQLICAAVTTMEGNTPLVGSGNWTKISGPAGNNIESPGNSGTSISGLVAGTYVFRWTISNGTCATTSDDVTVIVQSLSSSANAGTDQALCISTGTATLSGNTPSSGTGIWSQTSGPASATFSDVTAATPTISGLVAGNYVFRWTITNAPCASTFDEVNVRVDALPSASNAGIDQTLCIADGTTNLAANVPGTGTGIWTKVSGPAGGTLANSAFPNSAINALQAGTYQYEWAISNGTCPVSRDNVTIIVQPIPTVANAGIDRTVCSNTTSLVLSGNNPTTGNGGWAQVSGPGALSIAPSSSPTATINGLSPGTFKLTWTITGGTCPSTTDTLQITVIEDNSTVNAGTDQSVCDFPGIGALSGSVPVSGTGLWTKISGPASGTIVSPTSPSTAVNGLSTGTYVFQWTVTNAPCAVKSDVVSITVSVGSCDNDKDGVLNADDPDDDNDGILDITEGTGDSDNDGIPNHFDLDADNDGITDVLEAGGNDSNGDGIIDGFTDTNNDGLADAVDPLRGGTPLKNPDSDGDGIADSRDVDSDNDGITDILENGGNDTNGDGRMDGFTDSDANGLGNQVDPRSGGTKLPVKFTDPDTAPDYLDLDSDNDGITDLAEAMGIDTDGNGKLDSFADTDGDGLGNLVDTDNGGTPLIVPDSDKDGIRNYKDLDSDNDGLTDCYEAGGLDTDKNGIIDSFADSNGNGLSNPIDPATGGVKLRVPDTDGDSVSDYIDLDSDNDGITDCFEAGGNDANKDGILNVFVDTDQDGLADAVDPNTGGTPLVIPNRDSDTQADHLDLDSDNDGITDATEAGGQDASGDGKLDTFGDADKNGLADGHDPNRGGAALPVPDTDGDAIFDYQDKDSDNDGITDCVEAGGKDIDGDGSADDFTDPNENGLHKELDPSEGGTKQPVADCDLDGIGNHQDLDSDNDGITDVIEAGGVDSDSDGMVGVASAIDADKDGLMDLVDPSAGGQKLPLYNTDAIGAEDYLDLDSDQDGIVDYIEAQSTIAFKAIDLNDSDQDGIIDLFDSISGFGGSGIIPVNTDGAGLPDYRAIDTDGDGDSDNIEGWDTNNDGIAELVLSGVDADIDGIDDAYDTNDSDWNPSNNQSPADFPNLDDPSTVELDWRESQDNDADGISDSSDPDDDNDGVLDIHEGMTDTDGDGKPNQFDLDADNDGMTDVAESGGADLDGDGIIDNFEDKDKDGLADSVDPTEGGTPLTVIDTDFDTVPDFLDLDSDNDGITDVAETNNADNDGDGHLDNATDSDGDGLADMVDPDANGTPVVQKDQDQDGVMNHHDLDSDNDGITDLIEAGSKDSDQDGKADQFVDVNTNGYADIWDPAATGRALSWNDSDADGFRDYLDLDSDNDGIADISEAGYTDINGNGKVDVADDSNKNGLAGIIDPSESGTIIPLKDMDGDGLFNHVDLDSDNDGIPDILEANGDALDTDGDGILDGFADSDQDGMSEQIDPDNDGAPLVSLDTDNDGLFNQIDLDSDNDGMTDAREAGGADVNGDGFIDNFTDTDKDGLSNSADANDGGVALVRYDTDQDGHRDYLDVDSDQDGIPDLWENYQADADKDGMVDNFVDANKNGLADVIDPSVGGLAAVTPDFDNDGLLNYRDLDSDQDGITDLVEVGQLDANGNGKVDQFTDTNKNGWADTYEISMNGTALVLMNTDASGREDYLDIDSDNDGIVDHIEAQASQAYVAPLNRDENDNGLDDAYDVSLGGTAIVLNDIDVDNTPDYRDVNSDNDPESDFIEGNDLNNDGKADKSMTGLDSDGDGLDNAYDKDGTSTENTSGAPNGQTPFDGKLADNDNPGTGDLDFREYDADNDGVNNWDDLDDDNDGIPDISEKLTASNNGDTDKDGIADELDLDSDNDGIADLLESGGTDSNLDGRIDNFNDLNKDGWDDDEGITNPIDTDEDKLPDFQDLDSDNDGVTDLVEDGGEDLDGNGQIDQQVDKNLDGMDDTRKTTGKRDRDGDQVPDRLDLDSDNDGIADIIETGGTDTDGNGMVDNFTDTNKDGRDDNQMQDGKKDTDNDGVPDHYDLDSDNDGIPDVVENGLADTDKNGMVDNFTDTNGNGWDDGAADNELVDTDKDGTSDYLDLDSDGDGITDLYESGVEDKDGNGLVDDFNDANNDGWDDDTNTSDPVDTDGDGTPDYHDLDSDNDTVSDQDENDPNNDGIGPDDTDNDGKDDFRDVDDDNDGVGSKEEFDRDKNGIPDDCDGDNLPDYLDVDPCDLVIPEGFSPNGDRVNDYFVIKGLNAYPDNTLTIFNRWGNKVFEAKGYQNNWDGKSTIGIRIGGEELPTGTYFYILELGPDQETRNGYIYLNR